jgi:hypothetical protein
MPDPPGLYVYALTRPGWPAHALGTGIDDASLFPVTVGAVSAVVHEHPGAPYSGNDETLRRRVLQHNDLVERLWSRDRAVLPMTFDVIVSGTEDETARQRLEAWLRAIETPASEGLDRVDGRVELHVDLALDRREAAAADADVLALRQRIRDESPGIARLLRKRLDGLERDAADALADRIYPELRARLAACSADIVENLRATPGDGEVLVLSAALLVDEGAVDDVGRVLAAVQAEEPAMRVRFLGPWPPYSFAALRPEAPASRRPAT